MCSIARSAARFLDCCSNRVTTSGPEKQAALRAKYGSEARYRREIEIEYEALEGELLYPEFNRERNLQEPFDVSDPEYWTIWMALDPHPRTAHAMIWEAFNNTMTG